VKAIRAPFKSFAIYLFCVFVFFSLEGISHSAPCPASAASPLSAKTTHHESCALQAEDNGADVEKDDDFAKLCAVWASPPFSVASRLLRTHRSPFFKSIEISILLPRFPPL
jgi:hypothetical protein